MATLTEELLRQAEDIRENLAPEQRIPVAQARLYSRAVTTDWQTPPITWDQKWSSQSIQDILHLFRAGSIYADRALPEKSQIMWEHLLIFHSTKKLKSRFDISLITTN